MDKITKCPSCLQDYYDVEMIHCIDGIFCNACASHKVELDNYIYNGKYQREQK